jgi:hypothetical protein
MKMIHANIIHCALALSVFVSAANADDDKKLAVSIEKIAEFRESQNDTLLFHQLRSLQKEARPPAETVGMLCGILVEADNYLSAQQRPKGTPERNIAPPGGGRSGVDPASIVDPVERAAYQKLIDENKKLGEAHRKHSAVTRIRDSALDLLATYRVNGLISEPQLDAAIDQQGTSDNQEANLRQLVKTATANKAQHPTDGAAEPETPKE